MLPIVGLINFSTLCKKNSASFISSRESDWDSHKERVLARERLEERLFYIEKISLPLFDSQVKTSKSESFKLIILISSLLHSDLKDRIYKLRELYPWLIIEERGEDDWLDAIGAINRALVLLNNERSMRNIREICFASFRLDDDDFLSTNYLDSLVKYINEENSGKFITFPYGFKCCWKDGKIVNLVNVFKPLIAIGLAHIGRFDIEKKEFLTDPKTVFSGINHYKIGESSPVIEDPTPGMFIWSQHSYQDTHNRFKSAEIKNFWEVKPCGELYRELTFYKGLESYFKIEDA